MKILIVIFLLIVNSIVYAETTPNGEMEAIKKGQIVPFDGYLLDKRLINHIIQISEEKDILEKENTILKDEVKMNEIQQQEDKATKDALEKKVVEEKSGKILLGIAAFGIGILTGGVIGIILHLVP
jgi:hypothetical protein